MNIQELRDLVEGAIEPTEPQNTILRILKQHDGKPLTKRHTDQMRQETGIDSIRISKRHGMTHIEWGRYPDTKSLLVAYGEKNVVIDAADIEQKNSGWFSGAVERNEKRRAMLASAELLAEIVEAVVGYQSAKARLEALLDDDRLDADWPKIKEVSGLKDR